MCAIVAQLLVCWIVYRESIGSLQIFALRFLHSLHLFYNWHADNAVFMGRWDGGERTGHPDMPWLRNMRLLTLHTPGCPLASLRHFSSSSNVKALTIYEGHQWYIYFCVVWYHTVQVLQWFLQLSSVKLVELLSVKLHVLPMETFPSETFPVVYSLTPVFTSYQIYRFS